MRTAARLAVRLRDRAPAVRVGRVSCPRVCRATVSVYVLRGRGVRRTVRLGHVVLHLAAGESADIRVPLSPAARRLLRRHRRLNASLTLAANRVVATRRFTLRAA